MLIWHYAPIFETLALAKYSKNTSQTCRSFLPTSGEYDIPADTMVLVNQYAINHDKRAFENPEEFIPERFLDEHGSVRARPRSYLPFGLGGRACPGETSARTTLWMVMVLLCQRYKFLPPNGKELKVEYYGSVFIGSPAKHELLLESRL